MRVELRRLSQNDGLEIYSFLKTFPEEENGFMNPGFELSIHDFPTFLKMKDGYAQGIGLPDGYVPESIYWLYVDGLPVGIGKLRHYLTETLRNGGGHIGYSVTPEARGNGYGNLLLASLLKVGEKQGIKQFLISCNEENLPSRKVIERNNGQLERVNGGNCKYWI